MRIDRAQTHSAGRKRSIGPSFCKLKLEAAVAGWPNWLHKQKPNRSARQSLSDLCEPARVCRPMARVRVGSLVVQADRASGEWRRFCALARVGRRRRQSTGAILIWLCATDSPASSSQVCPWRALTSLIRSLFHPIGIHCVGTAFHLYLSLSQAGSPASAEIEPARAVRECAVPKPPMGWLNGRQVGRCQTQPVQDPEPSRLGSARLACSPASAESE